MNKTVTVNIGGIVFHIDENAYERFKQYLESIKMHFTASEGRDEIMQDIEARIAEMFQEKIKDQKQVITLSDVEEVTAIMGKPEDFGDRDSQTDDEDPSTIVSVKKRMFRNPDDKVLGGVCSGLAAYFDIDPVWIRLIFAFAFFFYGSGIVLYILLWIIIPKAETTTEKLQMRGEPITISNIEKNVNEERDLEKKRNISSKDGRKPGNIVNRIFEGIGQLLRLFFIFLGKLVAVIFVFIGLLAAIIFFASILAIFKVPGTTYPEVLNQIFPGSWQFGLAVFGAMLVVGIPLLMLAYAGLRILFNVRKSSRNVNMTAGGLWVLGLLLCIFMGASIAKDFSEKQSVRKEISLTQPPKGMLTLKMNDKTMSDKDYDNWDEREWNGDLRLSLSGDHLQSRNINLDIVESESDSFELVQICYARGSSRKLAADAATKISYTFSQNDSVMSFDPYFIIDKDEKYRAQRMQLILKVPVGSKVFLDKSLRGFIYDIKNVQNVLDRDMLKRTWEMKHNGLHCVDCTGEESTIGGGDEFYFDEDGSEVQINDHGIYIKGTNHEVLSIDSNGVQIKSNGKVKTIKKGDFHIQIE
jgi:phage shock protein PspC (stress-responsive transcriptional regulator)